MKNLIKGWVTSLFGLAIMIADALYFFGVVNLPEPHFVPKSAELAIAFVVGLMLFMMPSTWIEGRLNDLWNKGKEKI
jgi:hypothetical protein